MTVTIDMSNNDKNKFLNQMERIRKIKLMKRESEYKKIQSKCIIEKSKIEELEKTTAENINDIKYDSNKKVKSYLNKRNAVM